MWVVPTDDTLLTIGILDQWNTFSDERKNAFLERHRLSKTYTQLVESGKVNGNSLLDNDKNDFSVETFCGFTLSNEKRLSVPYPTKSVLDTTMKTAFFAIPTVVPK